MEQCCFIKVTAPYHLAVSKWSVRQMWRDAFRFLFMQAHLIRRGFYQVWLGVPFLFFEIGRLVRRCRDGRSVRRVGGVCVIWLSAKAP
jgi:hypothetical protein